MSASVGKHVAEGGTIPQIGIVAQNRHHSQQMPPLFPAVHRGYALFQRLFGTVVRVAVPRLASLNDS